MSHVKKAVALCVTLDSDNHATLQARAHASNVNISHQLDKDIARAYSLIDVAYHKIKDDFTLDELSLIRKAIDWHRVKDKSNRMLSEARVRRLMHIRLNITDWLRDQSLDALATKLSKIDLLNFWVILDIAEQNIKPLAQYANAKGAP